MGLLGSAVTIRCQCGPPPTRWQCTPCCHESRSAAEAPAPVLAWLRQSPNVPCLVLGGCGEEPSKAHGKDQGQNLPCGLRV